MPPLRPDIDPNGLLEYSVVFTDRSLNHMSAAFQAVMTDLSRELKAVYHADAVAIIPGSGTSAMEAVVDQLAQDYSSYKIDNHVAIGAEIQSVAPMLESGEALREGGRYDHRPWAEKQEDEERRMAEILQKRKSDEDRALDALRGSAA